MRFAVLIAAAAAGFVAPAQPGAPLRIGRTLSLTGPLGATPAIHKVAGDIYIDEVNRRGGLLGRKVEWALKDDQSRPELARTLYEQIVTADRGDLPRRP